MRNHRGAGDQSHTELAEVMLAALIGYASLVAAGFDVDPARFRQTLERLLDPPGYWSPARTDVMR
jgi:hypothetical protein